MRHAEQIKHTCETSERLEFTYRFKIILLSTCQLRASFLNANSQFNFNLFRSDTINTYKIILSYTKRFQKITGPRS